MQDNHIQYIEFQATDLEDTKTFYETVFGWAFTDWGPDYISFTDSGVEGGFARVSEISQGGALVVLYHTELEQTKERIVVSGGVISRDIFSFPGGRRFHFRDPNGNELAVWSDVGAEKT